MDDRVSSAVYNPHDPYDPSTTVGNRNLSQRWYETNSQSKSRGDFSSQLKLFLFQLGIFAAIGVGFTIFGG